MNYILSLSYGKDSLACLGAIEQLGLPLTRIVHAEVWATDTIPVDLPPMVEFKAKADDIIKRRWGIDVEHVRNKKSYEDVFYSKVVRGKFSGNMSVILPGGANILKLMVCWNGKVIFLTSASPQMNPTASTTLPIPNALRWWKRDGLRRCAGRGARKTNCSRLSTQRRRAVDAGFATTRALISFACSAEIIRNTGR